MKVRVIFDLATQIPIAIYSTIISLILNYPLNLLALSNNAFINFKQNNKKIKIMKKTKVQNDAIFPLIIGWIYQ